MDSGHFHTSPLLPAVQDHEASREQPPAPGQASLSQAAHRGGTCSQDQEDTWLGGFLEWEMVPEGQWCIL